MSTYQCPKGHISTESDYCSECGAKIQGSFSVSVDMLEQTLPQVSNSKNTITCPACSAPHDSTSGHFCEICGYNFNTGAHGEVPIIILDSDNVPSVSVEKTGHLETRHVSSLQITITVDPALRGAESPEPPNQPPIILRLDKETNLIGRLSVARGINPEIALNFDSAVSHRHALINRQSDSTFTLRDIDSANGTILNGVELTPMVDSVIQDGDEFILGHWTRIKVTFK
ncbi:phosphopeptide-binding protein [Calothrix sp. HK-06]|nr:phosphopeptide-binding protein [Calothrix sp. HK-06]